MQRGSMNQSNFEQYSLVDNKLYFECGIVSGGRSRIRQRGTIDTSNLRSKIAIDVKKLHDLMTNYAITFPPTGSGAGLFDGGRLEFNIESSNTPIKVSTTLDSIVNGNTARFKTLKRIAEKFRDHVGGEICDRADFYGISAPAVAS